MITTLVASGVIFKASSSWQSSTVPRLTQPSWLASLEAATIYIS